MGSPAAEPVKERWNSSRTNIFRFSMTVYSFIIMGMSDGALGALLPYIETYYNISYTVVSILFLTPFIGYIVAALSNNLIHHHFGQRGVAFLGSFCRLVGYIPMAFHPPYPSLPFFMLITGLGIGLEDSAWNAWVGNMENANELLGLLHGAYGAGATVGPLFATAMITKGGLPWYYFYYVMIGAGVPMLILTTASFWGATAAKHRAAQEANSGSDKRTTTREVLKKPIPWLLALFLLGYVGAEVALSGWIVTFMLRVRNAEPFWAGLTVTFFWLGLTVGRVVLGFITGRIGEKLAITAYLLASVAFQLLYWLVPNFAASATFASLLGFFLGPLFPAAIVAATKLLPVDHHVSAIGFAAAFGGSGGALFPFAVGAIAQSKGVEVLQPIALAILLFILIIWMFLPGGLKPGGLERARENQEGIGHDVKAAVQWVNEKRKGAGGVRKRTVGGDGGINEGEERV